MLSMLSMSSGHVLTAVTLFFVLQFLLRCHHVGTLGSIGSVEPWILIIQLVTCSYTSLFTIYLQYTHVLHGRQVRLTLDVGYSVDIQNADYTSNPTQSNLKPISHYSRHYFHFRSITRVTCDVILLSTYFNNYTLESWFGYLNRSWYPAIFALVLSSGKLPSQPKLLPLPVYHPSDVWRHFNIDTF